MRDQKQLNLGEQIPNASCAANDGLACYQIGQLGFAPPAGATTTPQEALYYSRRGCELGSGGACAVLGRAYINGTSEVEPTLPQRSPSSIAGAGWAMPLHVKQPANY